MDASVDPRLRLSAQRALLGAISPDIRLIKVGLKTRTITFTVIMATAPTEQERDALSVAAAEVLSDFPNCEIIEDIIIDACPIPRENILEQGWVYLRAERA